MNSPRAPAEGGFDRRAGDASKRSMECPVDDRHAGAQGAQAQPPGTGQLHVVDLPVQLLEPADVHPWAQVRAQFGANVKDTKQGRLRFREDFDKQLTKVLAFYRQARVETTPERLVLLPSPPAH